MMDFSYRFVCASHEYNSYAKHVPAPCFRKSFTTDKSFRTAELIICGLGFYDLYINGHKITKGLLAPYISNPDDIIYYDHYDLMDYVHHGENVIGIELGNGMQNAPGGMVWDFEKARFRGAPRFALRFEATFWDNDNMSFEADESFKTAPSPIYFDDLRSGVFYDSRKEMPGWNESGFNDASWSPAIPAETPRGEARICEADCITVTKEIKPVSITPSELYPEYHGREVEKEYKPSETQGYLYDFGVNAAGIYRLKINGNPGQTIELQFGEYTVDGKLSYQNINFYPDGYSQRDIFICKGGEEIYEPQFTYHGYRYCLVMGIDRAQAAPDLLTYLVCNSDLKPRGSFECSDKIANTLYNMTIISDLANFYYFPTDCPHREKNGWTGDAAASCEHINLNFNAVKSYTEWLRNIRAAQAEDGSLPGIVPTGGWGFQWGNGPAWDAALTFIPYYTYLYTGNKKIIEENSASILRYLNYISGKRRENGLIAIGLGDWLQPERSAGNPSAPLEFTDSVMCMNICRFAGYIFDELGQSAQAVFAKTLCNEFRNAVREMLVDFNTMTVCSRSQTAQAMAIYYDVFDNSEKGRAFDVLLNIIHENDDFLDSGLLGLRVVFHVLSDFGQGDLAYKMITRPEFPSYGHFIERGFTAMPEDFQHDDERPNSLNHHFLGDISNWFITKICGIRVNPHGKSPMEIDIVPDFINALDYAKAHYDSVAGRVAVEWKRDGENIILSIDAPDNIFGYIRLPSSYKFVSDDGDIMRKSFAPLKAGTYTLNVKGA